MLMSLQSFALSAFIIFALYALFEGLHRRPRREKQRDAVRYALLEFYGHMDSFAAYVQHNHPFHYKLLMLKLLQLESQLMTEAKAGRPLIPFGKYDQTYELYQEFLASRTESHLPKAA